MKKFYLLTLFVMLVGFLSAQVSTSNENLDNIPAAENPGGEAGLAEDYFLLFGGLYPPGTVSEGEPCGTDINGGCNMGTPAFTMVGPDDRVGGGLWYEGGIRDTDWFQMDLTEPSKITMSVLCDAVANFGLVDQTLPGVPGCDNVTGALFPFAQSQVEGVWTTLTVELDPGTYYFFIAMDFGTSVDGCTLGYPEYLIDFDVAPLCNDVKISNDPGLCSAVWDGSHGTNCNTPSGDIYPVGTTTVTCTAAPDTDANSTFYSGDWGYNSDPQDCSFTVEVTDDEDPVAKCKDITVQLDANGAATIVPADIENGSTDNCAVVSWELDRTKFGCIDVGTPQAVTMTVADEEGNTDDCTAMVTVEDNVAPTALCKDITIELDNCGNGSITATDIDNGSTDACGIASWEVDISEFTCEDLDNPVTVTLTVTDVNGNSSTCTSEVTVTGGPEILDCSVPEEGIKVTEDNGFCSAYVNFEDVVHNFCPPFEVVYTFSGATEGTSLNSDGQFNVGTTLVTVTVTDDNGCSDECEFTIFVDDEEDPIAACQDITVELDFHGNATITAWEIENGSSDDCGIVSWELDKYTFDCGDIGPNTVTMTVTDASGRSDQCTATVTVQDNLDPIVECQDVTIYLSEMGKATITYWDIIAPCRAIKPPQGPKGDGDGWMHPCISPYKELDNCGIVKRELSRYDFFCEDVTKLVGTHEVTLTATDGSDNSASCTAMVTVVDDIYPTALCQDITVHLDENGNATITPEMIDNGSYDNCGVELSLDRTTFGRCNLAETIFGIPVPVVLTVVDPSGNTSTCDANVTVEDHIAPILDCPADLTLNNLPGECNALVAFYVNDFNGDFAPEKWTTTGNVVFNMDDEEMHQFTFLGDVPESTAEITIPADGTISFWYDTWPIDGVFKYIINEGEADEEVVEIGCGTYLLTNFGITIPVNGGDKFKLVTTGFFDDAWIFNYKFWAGATISDNTNIVDVQAIANEAGEVWESGMFFPVGTTEVKLQATDLAGNSSTCSFNVTVEDIEAPMVTCQDITVELDAMGEATITVADVKTMSWDNCGIESETLSMYMFGCDDVGDHDVVLTIMDIHGNDNTCTATVTVEDNMAPVAMCQDITVELDANGMATITATQIDNGSYDNCELVSWVLDDYYFDCGGVACGYIR